MILTSWASGVFKTKVMGMDATCVRNIATSSSFLIGSPHPMISKELKIFN